VSPAGFNALDWLVAVIVVFSVAMSILKGFVREVFGLVALVAAVVLSLWMYKIVGIFFTGFVHPENLALLLGFATVFLGTLLAGWVVIWIVTRFMKFAQLQWIDRLLGAAYGLIRGWALGSAIFLGLTAFDVQTERVRTSELAQFLLPGARVLAAIAPGDMKARFLTGYRAVELWWHGKK
jgi:membrane protein required for colicin V production